MARRPRAKERAPANPNAPGSPRGTSLRPMAENPRGRIMRVFLSSTFRDMAEERDELVKRVFPEIRRAAEDRGVAVAEVDLRWGITDEQAAEGRVLPLCLGEIDNSRPFFLCVLGERYGWVPKSISKALRREFPWLKRARGRSVTELEILHAVLNAPSKTMTAFFYLRDPAALDRLPAGANRRDFVAESRKHAAKLRKLKSRIRASGFPVREGYRDARELGEWVKEDLRQSLDRVAPPGSSPDPFERETDQHGGYAAARRSVFLGGERAMAALDAWAEDAASSRALLICGASGSGKSALLANWASRRQARELVIEHYVGATSLSADWAGLVRRILEALRRTRGIAREIPSDPRLLRHALAEWLPLAARSGPILLILDGLDQLEDRDGALDLPWLPVDLPPGVRIAASALAGRAHAEADRRGWVRFETAALTKADRRALVAAHLGGFSKSLSTARVERMVGANGSGNPLFLRALLEEVRVGGVHERLDDMIGRYVDAADPRELFGRILARWQEDYERDRPGLVRDALRLIWGARRGLTESELLDALGPGMPQVAWAELHAAAGRTLSDHAGLIGFFHDAVRRAVEDRFVAGEGKVIHAQLAEFFDSRPASPRRIDELAWQLSRAGLFDRLHALLSNLEFFVASWDADQVDLKARWAELDAGSVHRRGASYPQVMAEPARFLDAAVRLASLLIETGRFADARPLLENLLGSFRSSRSPDVQRLRGMLAIALERTGEPHRALELHAEAEAVFRELGEDAGVMASLSNQAVIQRRSGALDAALARLEDMEAIARRVNDAPCLQIALGERASILAQQGKTDEAIALFAEEERICRREGIAGGLAISLSNQAAAVLARDPGAIDRAAAFLLEAERIARAQGLFEELLNALLGLHALFRMKGDTEAAARARDEALRIVHETGSASGRARVLVQVARSASDSGDTAGARRALDEAETIGRALEERDVLKEVLTGKARLLIGDDIAGAVAALEEAAQLADEVRVRADVLRTRENLAQALVARGREALKQGAERLARACAIRAEALAGGAPELAGGLGSLFVALGETDRAIPLLEAAARRARTLQDVAGLVQALVPYALAKLSQHEVAGAEAARVEITALSAGEDAFAEIARNLAQDIERFREASRKAAREIGAGEELAPAVEQIVEMAAKARREAEAAGKTAANLAASLCDRANEHMRAGQFDQALDAFRDAINADPGYSYAWSDLGGCLLKMGESASAVEALEHAFALLPDDFSTLALLGTALARRGRLDEARTHLDQCRSIDAKGPRTVALAAEIERASNGE